VLTQLAHLVFSRRFENFVERASEAKSDVMLADVNHYRVNELQAADITLRQIVQFYIEKARKKGAFARR